MKKPLWGLLLMLSACRPDPGPADYSGQGPIGNNNDGGTDPEEEVLPGPFPFEDGQRRLMVGIFYETGHSEEVVLDNVDTNFYLYDNTVYVEDIFDPVEDRVEGKFATKIVQNGKPWMGFGVHWTNVHNLDTWKTLHVSMKSSEAAFANVKIGMSSGVKTDEKGYPLAASKYGYVNDGAWHHLAIPIADFTAAGLKLNAVSSPFTFAAEGGAAGQSLLLDNLYFTAN
ncbi:putative glycoside hydrolase [Corallococcus terminator]|uniref:ExoP galactose-binding-like domain-containing protein n=1 Tax=Corallococcus terminator TaxID=2316733 RepID=A0A3A8J8G8_9BACT|nr:putative glycoside hydrolase [Corallococcus terminator]RKG91785.1 hypothetical protein D7V88_08520 [Corallococcus terminator]